MRAQSSRGGIIADSAGRLFRRGSLYQHPKARAENEADEGENGLQDKGACGKPGGGEAVLVWLSTGLGGWRRKQVEILFVSVVTKHPRNTTEGKKDLSCLWVRGYGLCAEEGTAAGYGVDGHTALAQRLVFSWLSA